MFAYSSINPFPLLDSGTQVLTFLGAEYVGEWRRFAACFLTEQEQERYYLRSTMLHGRSVSPYPILALWRSLGAPFFPFNGGNYPAESEWRPFIGRRVRVTLARSAGQSGRECAHARWEALR